MVGQFCNLERRALSGGAERIGHPERSGHHDDLCLVVAGCLVALSTPLSGAEGWCRLYEAWSQGRRYGGETYATDVDPIRPPAFGYSFEAAQFVTLIVPAPFDAEGGLNLDGGWHGFRRSGDRTTLDVSRKAAAQLLKHFAWRAANPDLKIEEDEAA